jgi:hypothetical protein
VESEEVIEVKTAAFKVPDGKLLKVRLKTKDHTIHQVVLMGDFFMHPEEALHELESKLVGLPMNSEILTSEIEQFLTTKDVTLIGATAGDFAKVIMMAE